MLQSSESSTEQRHKRKRYLIRSSCDEVPRSSPTPEIQEMPLETSAPTEVFTSRPYSPLPDLIIEKEPNRHDEPEEFYKGMEKRVMEYYRKLFIDPQDSPLSPNLENYEKFFLTFDRKTCVDPSRLMETNVSCVLSLGNNESSNSNNRSNHDQDSCDFKNSKETNTLAYKKTLTEKEKLSDIERSNEIRKETMSTTSESQNNDILITQALVHRTINEEMDYGSSTPVDVTQTRAVVTSTAINSEDSDEESAHEHLETEFEDSSISNEQHEVESLPGDEEPLLETGNATNSSTSQEEPEIMRKRTNNSSVESFDALGTGRCFSEDFSIDKSLNITSIRQMEELHHQSSPENSIILQNNFTSNMLRNDQEPLQNMNGHRKRRISTETSSHRSRSSQKQRKFENLATQTSFSSSDDETNWHKIKKRFFEGNPRVFKLCSCNNHVCC